uniref:Leucine-rich repeat-containing N-terminal plant-type domain-containing protein n=1 Tax=Triticum urartu TaxID=4572 RepID=A0A8R7Q8Q0_TRIUA
MCAWRSLKFSSTLVLTTLLLLLCGSGAAHCSVVHNSTDRRALLDFKEAITVDPTGVLRSWNDSIHHCMWPGVNCSRRHPGRVTVLDLDDMSLAGP